MVGVYGNHELICQPGVQPCASAITRGRSEIQSTELSGDRATPPSDRFHVSDREQASTRATRGVVRAQTASAGRPAIDGSKTFETLPILNVLPVLASL